MEKLIIGLSRPVDITKSEDRCPSFLDLLKSKNSTRSPHLENGVDRFNCVATIDDYAKDGGEELFTKMHCVLITNP